MALSLVGGPACYDMVVSGGWPCDIVIWLYNWWVALWCCDMALSFVGGPSVL